VLTFATVVCPVDFSDHSRAALARAGAWARQFKARLIVVTVVEPLLVEAAAAAYDMDLVREEMLPEVRVFVEQAFSAAGSVTPPGEAVVLVGDPATEIVALSRREHADLLVIATHGLSGYRKMLLGSTVEKVLRQTTVPVLVAPPSEQTSTAVDYSRIAVGRVLAPVDFKDESVRDVRAAADLAQALGVPLLVAHVVAPVKGLERLRPHFDTHNRVQLDQARSHIQSLMSKVGRSSEVETLVAAGSPAEEIAQIALARDAGLIVMGLRRHEHLFGPRPGSIVSRVLGLAPAKVLALPPGETDARWLRTLAS
jgi:universal stress protein A